MTNNRFPGVDIDHVHGNTGKTNNKRGINQYDPQERIDRCVALLASPMTTDELIAASGYCESSVKRYLQLLHKVEPKRIHICEHRKNTIVYQAGNLPDVPKTTRKSLAAKKRETDDDGPRQPVNVTIARDQMVAALFGDRGRPAA